MSNIFAPLVRPFGTLPVLVESGPSLDHTEYMHMLVSDLGELLCSNNAIHHYGAAIPFDIYGRVVVSESDVVRWDQDIPFTASGAVAMKASPELAHWDQGLIFTDTGHIATGDVEPPPGPPVWSEIPDTQNFLYELPQTYDVSPYVSEAGDPITGYALVSPPSGFSIDGTGLITCAVGASVGAHVLTVEATNGIGSSTTTFTWTLSTGNVPTWTTIPTQSHRVNELPQTLDIKPYASSDSGPILSYQLVTPPPGISMAAGIITVAAGTAESSYLLTVRAVNGVGAGDTTFTWDILEELVAPEWSVIPNQTDLLADLPESFDVSLYVTSNAGALRNWLLITPPVGFTIDQAGVVTASAGTAIADHTVVVQVENDVGSASSSFQWLIANPLPPQWQTIPPTSTSEELLPAPYDVSPYASSNSGPLTGWTLNPPVAGFSINGSGVVTAAAGIAPGTYPLIVEVTNDIGTTASDPFNWEIELFFLVPQWSTIPGQSNGDDELPLQLDVAPYVTTNSGPLTTWALVTPPTGFTIDAAGVITVAVGTAETTHAITVSVSNDEGSADSDPFNWTITDVLVPPLWGTVPDQNTSEQNLPDTLDLAPLVSTNDGPLTGWTLTTAPAGFTVSATGVVTAAAGIAPGTHTLQARVDNNSGSSSSNIFDWDIGAFFLPPQWSTIPAQSTEEQLLPVVLDVKPYVTSNHGPLASWSLVLPPGGWTIDSDGIITVAAARPVGSNSITVRVANDSGIADSAAFQWDILEEPLVPQWSTIPGRQDRENTLPQNYDISGYVTSNSGALSGWSLVAPPTGFTISGAGVITVAAGTTVAIHSLTVRVSNDEGSSDSAAFTWEVQEELLPPQWGVVPDRSDRINILPQTYDMSFYVTSNAGTLINWRLDSSPSGFSIDSGTGIITATSGAGVGDHSLRVGVTNSIGEELSNFFQWEILEELLPPQWQTIPNRSDDDDTLPQTYDVSAYVTSNSGPLDTWSLVSNPGGFTINQSGVITAATDANKAANPITVRVFNDEGGSDQTFTWTIVQTTSDEVYHEFNATVGLWDHERSGTAWGFDNTDTVRSVGTDVAVYEGCGYSGSAFVPNAGFLGIRIDSKSTNYWLRSNDIRASGWATYLSSTSSASLWNLEANPQTSLYRTASMGGTDDWSLSIWVKETQTLTSPGTNLVALTPDFANVAYIDYSPSRSHEYGRLINRTLSNAGITGESTNGQLDCKFFQAELGFGGATGPILTNGSAVTRNAADLSVDNGAFGWGNSDMADGFAAQTKFRCNMPNNDSNDVAPGGYITLYGCVRISGGANDISNYAIAYLVENSVVLDIYRNSANVAQIIAAATLQEGGDYDLRLRVDPSVGIRLWLDGPGVSVDAVDNGSFAQWTSIPFTHKLGMFYEPGEGSDQGSGSNTYKSVRINRTVPTDGEIIAWP